MSAELKQKLVQGETVYGTLIQNTISPSLVDAIPAGTLDFVIVSDEHTAFDIGDFLPMRYALAAKGIACLARTHSRSPDDVAKVCDTYDGVVVPYVEDYEECKQLAAAAVYRPLKGAALDFAKGDVNDACMCAGVVDEALLHAEARGNSRTGCRCCTLSYVRL